ncbi:MAG: hypothetical protein OEM84_10635 [Acidimicrobiia bacterium]|nr:hypothetical protein [Acidimicrobiia bacterium]
MAAGLVAEGDDQTVRGLWTACVGDCIPHDRKDSDRKLVGW